MIETFRLVSFNASNTLEKADILMTIAYYFFFVSFLQLQQDFKTLFPEKSEGLFENFPTAKQKLFEIAKKRTGKDKYIQNLLSLEKSE